MDKLIIKDRTARRRYASNAILRRALKYICHSDFYSSNIRLVASQKLSSLSRKRAKKTRFINCCILSGRSKAVYKNFRLSRIMFRNLAHEGKLYGITKSSW